VRGVAAVSRRAPRTPEPSEEGRDRHAPVAAIVADTVWGL